MTDTNGDETVPDPKEKLAHGSLSFPGNTPARGAMNQHPPSVSMIAPGTSAAARWTPAMTVSQVKSSPTSQEAGKSRKAVATSCTYPLEFELVPPR